MPLIVFYGVCIPLTAFGLYAACWLFGVLGVRTRLLIVLGLLVVLSMPLFWPIRRSVELP